MFAMSSTSWKNRDKIRVFKTVVDNVCFDEAKTAVREMLLEARFHKIFTPNTEIVMACRDDENLAGAINSADLVVADGIGLVIGSKMKACPLAERVTGFDLSIYLLELAAEENMKIFFLGAKPGVAETAAARVKEKYGDIVAGVHHGYFKSDEDVVDRIERSGAEILFVGLGFPKQERFILRNQDRLKSVRVAIGNGGVLDVLAGEAKRAPEVFIRYNLEWLYRLMKNPSRLSRQMAIPKFLWNIRRDKDSVSFVPPDKGGSHGK